MKIKGNNIGIVGDLHLGSKNGNDSEQWEKVYDDLLEWIIDSFYGKVETVMFLGDIFDGKFSKTTEKAMSFRTLNYANSFFEKLSELFQVIAFSGNHDVYYKNRCDVSALSLLKNKPNIHIIEDITDFKVGNLVYRIVPWSCDLANDVYDDGYDAIFAHLDIQSFKLNAFKVSEHGYTTKELFKYCDKVYTGHYHHRQQRDYQKGSKEIFYVGSPLQINWAEADKDSYIYILDLEKNEIEEEFRNEISPKHLKLKASDILENQKKLKDNIVEVLWDIPREDNLKKMELILDKKKTFHHKMNFEQVSKKINVEEFEEINSTIDPAEQTEEFIKNTDWKQQDKILEKCVSLINIVK